MEAVILADRYSRATVEKIIQYYKRFGIDTVIVVQGSGLEQIEEIDFDFGKIIYAKVPKNENYILQLKRIKSLISDSSFFLTFGNNFCKIDLNNLKKFHSRGGKVASIATVRKNNCYENAGFMVLETDLFEYVTDKMSKIEAHLLSRILQDDELGFYRYDGKCENVYANKQIFY